jgi:flavorubredoxin
VKTAIIYVKGYRRLDRMVELLSQTLQKAGHSVDLFRVNAGEQPGSFRRYDRVYVGSPVLGYFRGRVPPELTAYLQKALGLDRPKTAVFVTKRLLGNSKTTKTVMALLESQGSQVVDFEFVGSPADVERFAKRLHD